MSCDRLLTAYVLGLFLVELVSSYAHFRVLIPNGELVPSPCNPNHVWQGVGHRAKSGGGKRNQFGQDFEDQGYVWTKILCKTDSDGDGRTNGEELGDPDCSWVSGSAPPSISVGLSHPGFCDPPSSEVCKAYNSFLDCSTAEFSCAALLEPNVTSYDVKLTESAVPDKETTYMCQVVDLPTDQDYHLVAAEPLLTNINVVHHIIVYGCTVEANITAENRQPSECFMNTIEHCDDMIALWGVGADGICYHADAGFKVGPTGYTKALVEVHWNNPTLESTYRDGSGMTLHLTPNLRPNEAGIIMIGQTLLIIPPDETNHTVNSSCSSDCTSQLMSKPVQIVGVFNHMHYLGIGALTQMVLPNGSVIPIAFDKEYSYDSPVITIFDEPKTMKPGYELQMFCHFRSTSRSKTTFYGEGTSDEMCFSFIIYYPKEDLPNSCTSHGPIDRCDWEKPVIRECQIETLWNPAHADNVELYTAVQDNCKVGICLEECKDVIRGLMMKPCFQWPLPYIFQEGIRSSKHEAERLFLMEYWYRIDSCASTLARENCGDDDWNNGRPDVDEASSMHVTSVLFVFGVSMFFSAL